VVPRAPPRRRPRDPHRPQSDRPRLGDARGRSALGGPRARGPGSGRGPPAGPVAATVVAPVTRHAAPPDGGPGPRRGRARGHPRARVRPGRAHRADRANGPDLGRGRRHASGPDRDRALGPRPDPDGRGALPRRVRLAVRAVGRELRLHREASGSRDALARWQLGRGGPAGAGGRAHHRRGPRPLPGEHGVPRARLPPARRVVSRRRHPAPALASTLCRARAAPAPRRPSAGDGRRCGGPADPRARPRGAAVGRPRARRLGDRGPGVGRRPARAVDRRSTAGRAHRGRARRAGPGLLHPDGNVAAALAGAAGHPAPGSVGRGLDRHARERHPRSPPGLRAPLDGRPLRGLVGPHPGRPLRARPPFGPDRARRPLPPFRGRTAAPARGPQRVSLPVPHASPHPAAPPGLRSLVERRDRRPEPGHVRSPRHPRPLLAAALVRAARARVRDLRPAGRGGPRPVVPLRGDATARRILARRAPRRGPRAGARRGLLLVVHGARHAARRRLGGPRHVDHRAGLARVRAPRSPARPRLGPHRRPDHRSRLGVLRRDGRPRVAVRRAALPAATRAARARGRPGGGRRPAPRSRARTRRPPGGAASSLRPARGDRGGSLARVPRAGPRDRPRRPERDRSRAGRRRGLPPCRGRSAPRTAPSSARSS
jgi:hypothetical protein